MLFYKETTMYRNNIWWDTDIGNIKCIKSEIKIKLKWLVIFICFYTLFLLFVCVGDLRNFGNLGLLACDGCCIVVGLWLGLGFLGGGYFFFGVCLYWILYINLWMLLSYMLSQCYRLNITFSNTIPLSSHFSTQYKFSLRISPDILVFITLISLFQILIQYT